MSASSAPYSVILIAQCSIRLIAQCSIRIRSIVSWPF
jgi:hypothetical protein